MLGRKQRGGSQRIPGVEESRIDCLPIRLQHSRHDAPERRERLGFEFVQELWADVDFVGGIQPDQPDRHAGSKNDARRQRIDENVPFGRTVLGMEHAAVLKVAGHPDSSAHDDDLARYARRCEWSRSRASAILVSGPSARIRTGVERFSIAPPDNRRRAWFQAAASRGR